MSKEFKLGEIEYNNGQTEYCILIKKSWFERWLLGKSQHMIGKRLDDMTKKKAQEIVDDLNKDSFKIKKLTVIDKEELNESQTQP